MVWRDNGVPIVIKSLVLVAVGVKEAAEACLGDDGFDFLCRWLCLWDALLFHMVTKVRIDAIVLLHVASSTSNDRIDFESAESDQSFDVFCSQWLEVLANYNDGAKLVVE